MIQPRQAQERVRGKLGREYVHGGQTALFKSTNQGSLYLVDRGQYRRYRKEMIRIKPV